VEALWFQNRENDNAIQTGPAAFDSQLACMLTAGCALGPDFYEPAAPNVTGSTKEPLKPSSASDGSGKGQGQRFVENLDIPGQWWETFHSRPLNDLIEDALKHNPDVQGAQAGLRVARETTEAQKGAYAPQISTGYNSYTQKVSSVVSPPGSTRSDFLTLHTVQVDVSYSLGTGR
jgi:outer membrane protein TolC